MFFRPLSIPTEFRPPRGDASAATVRLTWLGTAGFVVEHRNTVLLIDPYVSRLGVASVLLSYLIADRREIDRYVPRATHVVAGHSHYDHLMDVPEIARRDRAVVIGSRSTAALLRAAGVGEAQLRVVPREGGTVQAGDVTVTLVESRHGRALLARVPMPGQIRDGVRWPARARDFRAGDVYGVLVRAGDVTLYHNGSADVVDATLAGRSADVLLVGIAGSAHTPDYLGRLVRALSPKVLLPIHYDAFFAPLDRGLRSLPVADVGRFLAEARRVAPGTRVVMPDLLEPIGLAPGGQVFTIGG